MNPVEVYLELLESQLLERAQRGGALTEDREGEYVEQFDLLWRNLNDEQQRAVEEHLASKPYAPEVLDVLDVQAVGRHLPRRAA